MNVWGTTVDWAGSGPHRTPFMEGDRCCPRGELKPVLCRGENMAMLDAASGEALETWQCTECHRVWFRRPGMTGFFAVQPAKADPFRA